MEKRAYKSGFYIEWGNKGLKVSFGVLILLIILLFAFVYVRYGSVSEFLSGFLIPPNEIDFMAFLAGCILFILVPFLLGIRVGMEIKIKNKKGVAIENLVWWIIAVAVLAIIIILAVVLRDKLVSIGSFLKNLFRFRG